MTNCGRTRSKHWVLNLLACECVHLHARTHFDYLLPMRRTESYLCLASLDRSPHLTGHHKYHTSWLKLTLLETCCWFGEYQCICILFSFFVVGPMLGDSNISLVFVSAFCNCLHIAVVNRRWVRTTDTSDRATDTWGQWYILSLPRLDTFTRNSHWSSSQPGTYWLASRRSLQRNDVGTIIPQ